MANTLPGQTTAFILDTNILFNMEAKLGMGETSKEIIVNLTALIKKRRKEGFVFYVPPRIMAEILTFFDDEKADFLQEFFACLIIKAPDVNDIELSANLFYKVINEIRSRSYRGMDIAEEEIKKAGQLFTGKENMDRVMFEKAIGPVVKTFRDRYRNATRVGFLDSLADLDLIMLAKEYEAAVVSTDEGVLKWGRMFGVREMPAHVFGNIMRDEV